VIQLIWQQVFLLNKFILKSPKLQPNHPSLNLRHPHHVVHVDYLKQRMIRTNKNNNISFCFFFFSVILPFRLFTLFAHSI
jgi:hypothetical protein